MVLKKEGPTMSIRSAEFGIFSPKLPRFPLGKKSLLDNPLKK
jgi:hypothetical protein